MMGFVRVVVVLLRAFLCSRSSLAAENLALRQQLAVLHRGQRPRLRKRDRIFWVWLSRLWRGWRSALLIVQPETVIRWHRQVCLLKTPSAIFYRDLRTLSSDGFGATIRRHLPAEDMR